MRPEVPLPLNPSYTRRGRGTGGQRWECSLRVSVQAAVRKSSPRLSGPSACPQGPIPPPATNSHRYSAGLPDQGSPSDLSAWPLAGGVGPPCEARKETRPLSLTARGVPHPLGPGLQVCKVDRDAETWGMGRMGSRISPPRGQLSPGLIQGTTQEGPGTYHGSGSVLGSGATAGNQRHRPNTKTTEEVRR